MNKVFVVGDFHGSRDIRKVNSKNWPKGKELDKDDILIQLGDFGLLWKPEYDYLRDQEEEHWINWLDEKPWTTVVVPGNHENWERIEALPMVDFLGAKCYKYGFGTRSIYFVDRGEILEVAGKKIFCFGGAASIDKQYRQFKISWWPQENPSHTDVYRALDNLEKHNNKVDFICAHTAPGKVISKKYEDLFPCSTQDFFDDLYGVVSYDAWHFGHFHTDEAFDEKHFCHYENSPKQII